LQKLTIKLLFLSNKPQGGLQVLENGWPMLCSQMHVINDSHAKMSLCGATFTANSGTENIGS